MLNRRIAKDCIESIVFEMKVSAAHDLHAESLAIKLTVEQNSSGFSNMLLFASFHISGRYSVRSVQKTYFAWLVR